MHAIHRYNYPSQLASGLDNLLDDIKAMLLEGRYILTAEVRSFEAAFAQFNGSAFCTGVNCGTDALLLTLLALGVGPGDEVITQANTFHATVAAIQLSGATPVLVDADDETFLIDATQVEATVTPRTRVIMPVHLYGKPTPMSDLIALAQAKGIHVVEDAAQAHGARLAGRRVGTFGVAGCFSFHPSKNLAAAGDAGAVITNDAGLARSLERYRALGQRSQNDHAVVGYNSKLDAIQARVLGYKLPLLDDWNAARRRIAANYREALAALPVRFQREDESEEHVYHLLQIRCEQRDPLLEHLQGNGIDAIVRYPVPIHLQPAFARWGWKAGQFPVAERLSRELLCLPVRPDMTEDEVEFVAGCVSSYYDRAKIASAH